MDKKNTHRKEAIMTLYAQIYSAMLNIRNDMSKIYQKLYNSVGYIKIDDICLNIDMLSRSKTSKLFNKTAGRV